MLFSIIVPVYNVEKYLDKCINSILDSTFEDYELILVDDGSTDNSPSICDRYAEIDNRITVIHKSNGGLSDARNTGIKNAKGDYIVFVDSDDYINGNGLLELSNKLNGMDVLTVSMIDASTNMGIDSRYEARRYTSKEYILGIPELCAVLYIFKKSFLLDNNLFFKYGIFHEDIEFTPRAILKADYIDVTNIPFYYHVIRPGSITTKSNQTKNIVDIYSTLVELTDYYSTLQDKDIHYCLDDMIVSTFLGWYYHTKAYKYKLTDRNSVDVVIDKRKLLQNAHGFKTIIKALLFYISPRLYCCVHDVFRVLGLTEKK